MIETASKQRADIERRLKGFLRGEMDFRQLQRELDAIIRRHPEARQATLELIDQHCPAGELLRGFFRVLRKKVEDELGYGVPAKGAPADGEETPSEVPDTYPPTLRGGEVPDTYSPIPQRGELPDTDPPILRRSEVPDTDRPVLRRGEIPDIDSPSLGEPVVEARHATMELPLEAAHGERGLETLEQTFELEEGTESAAPEDTGDIVEAGAVLRDRFVLEELLGEGATGLVFRALDRRRLGGAVAQRYVALKVLRDEFRDDPHAIGQLLHEFQLAQSLAHPHIVNLFDLDCDDGVWFVTMELLEGLSLRSVFDAPEYEARPLSEVGDLVRGMGEALAYAHARGIVHWDFKPENVFVTDEGGVKVLDFALARAFGSQQRRAVPSRSDLELRVTLSPAYASYEQLIGERPDRRDDVYAFACVCYELLAGRHPFGGRSALRAHGRDIEIQPVKGLSRQQRKALLRGLALRREDRWPDIESLLTGLGFEVQRPGTLQVAVSPTPEPPRRRGLAAALAAGLAAIVVALAVVFTPGTRERDSQTVLGPDPGPAAGAPRFSTAPTTPREGGVTLARPRQQGEKVAEPETITRPAVFATEAPPSARASRIDDGVDAAMEPQAAPDMAAPGADAPIPAGQGQSPAEALTAQSGAAVPSTESAVDTAPLEPADDVLERDASAGQTLSAADEAAADDEAEGDAAADDVRDVVPAAAPPQLAAAAPVVGPGTFQFSTDGYTVSETDSMLSVSIERSAGRAGQVSVDWWTAGETAQAASDYADFGRRTETFEDGEQKRTIHIPIASDVRPEPDEVFYVYLGDPTGGAVLGTVTRARVTILDDDS